MSHKQNEIFYESYREAIEETKHIKNISKKHDKKTVLSNSVQVSK